MRGAVTSAVALNLIVAVGAMEYTLRFHRRWMIMYTGNVTAA